MIPLVEMKRYLEEQGFRAYTLRAQFADLTAHVEKGRPVIVSQKNAPPGPCTLPWSPELSQTTFC